MCKRAKAGKKLPSTLAETVALWNNARTLRLIFQDEARFGRISDTRYCWCRRPFRPMANTMVTTQYTYAYGAVSHMIGRFDSHMLPQVNAECRQVFLDEVAQRYPNDNIMMVLDGGGWHKRPSCALAENVKLHFLPPYSPELNPIEHLWDELREMPFHNRVFDSIDTLEDHLVDALRALENDTERVARITRWPWIINAVSNAI